MLRSSCKISNSDRDGGDSIEITTAVWLVVEEIEAFRCKAFGGFASKILRSEGAYLACIPIQGVSASRF